MVGGSVEWLPNTWKNSTTGDLTVVKTIMVTTTQSCKMKFGLLSHRCTNEFMVLQHKLDSDERITFIPALPSFYSSCCPLSEVLRTV